MIHGKLLVTLLLTVLAARSVSGQDPAESAAIAHDPDVSLPALELLLVPMDQEDLRVELESWHAHVKESARALAEVQARRLPVSEAGIPDAGASDTGASNPGAPGTTAPGVTTGPDLDAATADLKLQLQARAERMRLVLGAFAAMGGDRAPHDRYLKKVAGVGSAPGVEDASAFVTSATRWLKDPDKGLKWLKNGVLALLALIVFRILAGISGKLVGRALATARPDTSKLLKDFFVGTTRKLVFVLGIIVALSMLEVEVGPFLAAMGVAGFVIGFALQETLSNFAAGMMILLYRPFELGNFISAAGVTGTVEAMNLVSTTLKTPDNQRVVVPNGSIWGGVITNVTGNPMRRVDLVFGIGYGDDIEKAHRVLTEIVKQVPEVLASPEPVVELDKLADSSVNFVVRPWAKTADYWKVYWAVTRKVKERFDAEDISIPFPQRDVHLHQS